MSDCKNTEIDIYLDDTMIFEDAKRVERKDVLSEVTELGGERNTPLPGFEEEIYIEDLDDGIHEVKIDVIDKSSNVSIGQIIKRFKKIPYKTKMYIDNPKRNEEVSSLFYVKGWSMSECSDTKINVLIDNTLIEEDIGRTERQDVLDKITGYGDKSTTPYPGFEINTNIKNLKPGKHTLKIQTIDRKEEEILCEEIKEFTYQKYKAFGYIDSFKTRQEIKGDLEISRMVNEYLQQYKS